MNIDTGWLLAVGVTVLGAGIGGFIRLSERITRVEAKLHDDLVERVAAMEALLSIVGKKAAKILHSPDDHHGIDLLLDKYLDRHYELNFEEWMELLKRCETIENNEQNSAGERGLAAFLAAICHHKTRQPPPIKNLPDVNERNPFL